MVHKPHEVERVHIRARSPLFRRCRLGYCFSAEGEKIELSPGVLAALRKDFWLVVTPLDQDDSKPRGDAESHEAPPKSRSVVKTRQTPRVNAVNAIPKEDVA